MMALECVPALPSYTTSSSAFEIHQFAPLARFAVPARCAGGREKQPGVAGSVAIDETAEEVAGWHVCYTFCDHVDATMLLSQHRL